MRDGPARRTAATVVVADLRRDAARRRSATSPPRRRWPRCSTAWSPRTAGWTWWSTAPVRRRWPRSSTTTSAEWRRVVDVCLTGGFLVIKHAGRVLGAGGSITSLTSLNARQPGGGLAAYCSAKAGLAMLTQVAALELGPRGIRVNAVSPGLVVTPLTAPALDIDGIEDDYLANTPLGRSGHAGGGRRGGGVLLARGVADRRGDRPQRRRAPDALPRPARPRDPGLRADQPTRRYSRTSNDGSMRDPVEPRPPSRVGVSRASRRRGSRAVTRAPRRAQPQVGRGRRTATRRCRARPARG